MINPLDYILTLENYHPLSTEYIKYWQELKKRCIEGYWSSGIWMPGKLYSYINFSTILLNKPGMKTKSFDRPWLRDIEWEIFRNFELARGFSGFVEDEEFTCNLFVLNPDEYWGNLQRDMPEIFRPDGEFKTFVPRHEYIRKQHSRNLGSPVYHNRVKNYSILGPRGFGKSFIMGGGVCAHEFLFDGLQKYNEEVRLNPPSTEVIIGAGDAKYSNDTCAKILITLESLPGSQEIGSKYYPSPFYKHYVGSLQPGKQIEARYDSKIKGKWLKKGTKSKIKNRTFKDNPFAGQGARASIALFEEYGMWDNVRASYAAMVDVLQDGAFKYGTGVFIGTGGDMAGGSTMDAHYMFYHPQEFDILEFDDIWEHQGKIGYFLPGEMGLNQFKDEQGFTKFEEASKYILKQREKLSSSRGSSLTLKNYIIYHPIKPSEMFLTDEGAIFPIAEIHERLTKIRSNHLDTMTEKRVTLFFNPDSVYNGVDYKLDLQNKLTPINEFPWKHQNREGAVVIYEFPILDPETNLTPKNLYIIGHDPFRTDSDTGESLASIYVLKTSLSPTKYGHNEIVAHYVGRPFDGRNAVNEILYKLSLFYGNAMIYFENEVGNVKEYFEKRKRLDLLARQPQTVLSKTASYEKRDSLIYGYPMSNAKIKTEAIGYLRDWLLEERGSQDTKIIRNIDLITDVGLLQEMMAFNMKGNFDRVMGIAGAIIGMEERHNKIKEEFSDISSKNDINFLISNKKLFKW